MKKIYKYQESFRRMGELTSVFVSDEATIAKLMKAKEVPLGEVLGKHSDITAYVNDETLVEISDDPAVISFLEKHFSGVIGVDLVYYYQDQADNGYYGEIENEEDHTEGEAFE